MYLPFHLSTGCLLNQFLNQGKSMPAVLFFSILPDWPYILTFVCNAFRKRGRRLGYQDLFGLPGALPAAFFMHSLIGLAAAALVVAVWAPERMKVFLIGYLSHLALDYPFHAPHGHRLFYPLPGFLIRSPLSYFDPAFHSREVNWVMLVVTVMGFLCIFR